MKKGGVDEKEFYKILDTDANWLMRSERWCAQTMIDYQVNSQEL